MQTKQTFHMSLTPWEEKQTIKGNNRIVKYWKLCFDRKVTSYFDKNTAVQPKIPKLIVNTLDDLHK